MLLKRIYLNGKLEKIYSYHQTQKKTFCMFWSKDRKFCEKLFPFLKELSSVLDIPCPYLGLVGRLRFYHSDGSISIQDARCYTPRDIPFLDNNLILISAESFDIEKILGVLAHEMRHFWQEKNGYKEKAAVGFFDSLYDSAEIDADAFGIVYLAHHSECSLEEAAALLCPLEKKEHPDAYDIRLEYAHHFNTSR